MTESLPFFDAEILYFLVTHPFGNALVIFEQSYTRLGTSLYYRDTVWDSSTAKLVLAVRFVYLYSLFICELYSRLLAHSLLYILFCACMDENYSDPPYWIGRIAEYLVWGNTQTIYQDNSFEYSSKSRILQLTHIVIQMEISVCFHLLIWPLQSTFTKVWSIHCRIFIDGLSFLWTFHLYHIISPNAPTLALMAAVSVKVVLIINRRSSFSRSSQNERRMVNPVAKAQWLSGAWQPSTFAPLYLNQQALK